MDKRTKVIIEDIKLHFEKSISLNKTLLQKIQTDAEKTAQIKNSIASVNETSINELKNRVDLLLQELDSKEEINQILKEEINKQHEFNSSLEEKNKLLTIQIEGIASQQEMEKIQFESELKYIEENKEVELSTYKIQVEYLKNENNAMEEKIDDMKKKNTLTRQALVQYKLNLLLDKINIGLSKLESISTQYKDNKFD